MNAVHAHLEVAARSEDPIVRAEALSSLAKKPGTEADQYLLRGVMDPSRWVQRAMAKALPIRTVDLLMGRPNSDSVARAVALAGLPVEKRRQIEIDLGRTSPADLVSWALLGDTEALRSLQVLAQQGDLPPEEDLLWAMSRIDSSVLGEALADGIPKAEELIRVQMALVAQYLAPNRGTSALHDALSDAPLEQRFEAVEGLVQYDTPLGRKFLTRASKGSSSPVQHHAQLAMVALTGGSVSVALEALMSPDRDVRAWAATCLMFSDTERPLHRSLMSALVSAQQDEAPAVRTAAVRALLLIGAGDSVVIPVGFWTRQPDTVSTMIGASLWVSLHP
jgi:HEAT repeat protein